MYVLLKRAKKNVGDFLIGERAEQLVATLKPGHELRVLNAWEKLDEHLALLNGADAVIICGGPGTQERSYPHVYPLVSPLERITAPIALLGSGWYGVPGDERSVAEARFTTETRSFFARLDRDRLISVRDYLTQRVLRRAGFENVRVTGCPAWYHQQSFGKPLEPPRAIERVVFTPPRDDTYREQCRALMTGLRRQLPKATLFCSFHRGITADTFTSAAEAEANERMLALARELGYEVRDVSYDLDKISFYADCDLHVGYRVHAHLDFLAQRRPSVLIAEDSRGRGACEALGLQAFPAWRRRPLVEHLQRFPGRLGRGLRRRYGFPYEAAPSLAAQVLAYLGQELRSGFRRYRGIGPLLDRAYDERMRPFVEGLPG